MINEMKWDYVEDNMSLRKLSVKYKKGRETIKKMLIAEGIVVRESTKKFLFDCTFFNEIDTEEKAYWLGFIWCDATTIAASAGKKRLSFKLSLSSRDEGHVYKFKNAIKSEHLIKNYKVSGFTKAGEQSWESRIVFSDDYFCNVLRNRYNMTKGRPNVIPINENIPEHLIKHFIRGVYDADGSITLYHTQEKTCRLPTMKMSLQLYSNIELIQFIQEYFVKEGLRNRVTKTVKRHKDGDGNSTGLCISGTNQVTNILSYLYDDASVYLDRKFEQANNLQEAKRMFRLNYKGSNQHTVKEPII